MAYGLVQKTTYKKLSTWRRRGLSCAKDCGNWFHVLQFWYQQKKKPYKYSSPFFSQIYFLHDVEKLSKKSLLSLTVLLSRAQQSDKKFTNTGISTIKKIIKVWLFFSLIKSTFLVKFSVYTLNSFHRFLIFNYFFSSKISLSSNQPSVRPYCQFRQIEAAPRQNITITNFKTIGKKIPVRINYWVPL